MISLTDRIAPVGVVISPPKQACACRCHLPVQIFRVACGRRVRGFMNHTHNAFAFHGGKIGPHHVVMREIHYVAGGKGTRRKRKKQGRSPQDRQSHQHPKSQLTYRAEGPELASASFAFSFYGKDGVAPAKSASAFTFQNKFLSCDVTDTTRSFPSAARRPAKVCNEKSSPESALLTFGSASCG